MPGERVKGNHGRRSKQKGNRRRVRLLSRAGEGRAHREDIEKQGALKDMFQRHRDGRRDF